MSRQRRFIGWFAFDFRLSDSRQPADVAAESLFRGAELVEALNAVRRARFVLAIVTSTDGKRTTFLELESEAFEVRNTTYAQLLLPRGSAIVAHLVPVRNRYWLAGPGWLQWPIGIGPNMRGELSKFQFDPIQLERLMQGRAGAPDGEPHDPAPQDSTLEEAVGRFTSAARDAGRPELIMSVEQWRAVVLHHMAGTDPRDEPDRLALQAYRQAQVTVDEILALVHEATLAADDLDRIRAAVDVRQQHDRIAREATANKLLGAARDTTSAVLDGVAGGALAIRLGHGWLEARYVRDPDTGRAYGPYLYFWTVPFLAV